MHFTFGLLTNLILQSSCTGHCYKLTRSY